MAVEQTKQLIIDSLEDMKAEDIVCINVQKITSLFDYVIIASGTSSRHVKAVSDKTIRKLREDGIKPLSSEGEKTSEWILIDFTDIIVHVMQPETREFYKLEELWTSEHEQAQSQA